MAEDTIEEIKEEFLTQEEESDHSAQIDENISESKNESQEENEKKTEEEKIRKQKKVPFLNKILFGLVGFLLLLLIVGLVLFFMGFFDTKEVKTNISEKKELAVKEETRFNIKDINSKKLNKQLLLLTNKNLMEEENEAREKLEEEKKIKLEEEKRKKETLALEQEKISKEKESLENKKIELQKQKEQLEVLKEEAIALRNEMLNSKKLLEVKKEETIEKVAVITNNSEVIEENETIIESENKFVSLINVAKINGELYKSYLDKIIAINSDVKLCRDELNRIEIYYGPFEDNSTRNKLYKKLQKNGIKNSYEVELTKEEFDKRCNY